VLDKGRPGECYNIGGGNERANIDLAHILCGHLDELRPRRSGRYADLVKFVTDRPGHDRRYAIDAAKIRRELGWMQKESFETGLRKTIEWYLGNEAWMKAVTAKT
jgi:dTDP-glucose 4,6-dehydratase